MIENICNICGKELHESEKQDGLLVHRRFGYGSIHDDEEHRVLYCLKCFEALIKSCTLPTQIEEYKPALPVLESYNDLDDPQDPVPGAFCTKCGKGLDMFDIQEKLVLQGEINNQKHHTQLCCDCLDDIIKNCKKPPLIKDWGAH